jgi:hypothetical protein
MTNSEQTIDLTPSWQGLMPALIAVLRGGNLKGVQEVTEELTRLAKEVDAMNKANAESRKLDKVQQARKVLEEAGYVCPTKWHIEDIQSVSEDKGFGKMKDADAMVVAQIIADNHNPELGINWLVIEEAIRQWQESR